MKIKLSNKTFTISNAGFEAVIIDFGFAVFPRIKNPLINANQYKNIGISRKSDKHYDLHAFLNSIHAMVRQPRTTTERIVKTFVQSLLPDKYLVNNSNVVKNYRLRGNKTVKINFEDVLSRPFFTGEKTVISIPKPKNPVVPIVPTKKIQSPVNKKAAMARAVAMMKVTPKKRKPIVRRK
jgi:hypothetical protein